MASEYETMYARYKVIDVKTGAERHGKYFVLKLDSADQEERKAVFAALSTYAKYQAAFGYKGYAEAVMRYAKQCKSPKTCNRCKTWQRDGKTCVGTCPHQDGMTAEWMSGCPFFSQKTSKGVKHVCKQNHRGDDKKGAKDDQ